MSPRRTRPRGKRPRAEPDELRIPAEIVPAPPGWHVRRVQPAGATKSYRCPGCQQEIRPATAHVVAWHDEDAEGRRHWHSPCWEREARAGRGRRI